MRKTSLLKRMLSLCSSFARRRDVMNCTHSALNMQLQIRHCAFLKTPQVHVCFYEEINFYSLKSTWNTSMGISEFCGITGRICYNFSENHPVQMFLIQRIQRCRLIIIIFFKYRWTGTCKYYIVVIHCIKLDWINIFFLNNLFCVKIYPWFQHFTILFFSM